MFCEKNKKELINIETLSDSPILSKISIDFDTASIEISNSQKYAPISFYSLSLAKLPRMWNNFNGNKRKIACFSVRMCGLVGLVWWMLRNSRMVGKS